MAPRSLHTTYSHPTSKPKTTTIKETPTKGSCPLCFVRGSPLLSCKGRPRGARESAEQLGGPLSMCSDLILTHMHTYIHIVYIYMYIYVHAHTYVYAGLVCVPAVCTLKWPVWKAALFVWYAHTYVYTFICMYIHTYKLMFLSV